MDYSLRWRFQLVVVGPGKIGVLFKVSVSNGGRFSLVSKL